MQKTLICIRCKTEIKDKHWNSKYCKDCAYIINLEKRKHRYYQLKELGTTNFREHRCKTFDKEQKEINKEYIKLGLKKDKLYKTLYFKHYNKHRS